MSGRGLTMQGIGDTTAYLRRGIREIICLALFFFTFLACEYLFDVRMAEFVPSSEVVIYESIVVGASVIGFFVRPSLYYRRPQMIDATSDITGVLLVSALLLMIMAVRFEVVIAGGLVACCALGYCGSTAHANLARRFAQTPCLARRGGFLCCGHFGAGAQPYGDAFGHSPAVCSHCLCDCAGGAASRARRAKLRDEPAPEFEVEIAELSVDVSERGVRWHDDPEAKAAFQGAVVRLTVATACLTGVFAALNAGLTTSHAAGAIDLGDWPRLLLVVSALAAGVLYDLRGRSYMNIIMTCAAMLSTLFVLCAYHRWQRWQHACRHDYLLPWHGLFRGVLHRKVRRDFDVCPLGVSVAVHEPCYQQCLLDTRDGSGGGDYLELKRAGGSERRARAVCRHRDFAVRTV